MKSHTVALNPRTRLVIVQPYVPRYRTAFYASASALLFAQGIDLQVVVGRRDSDRHDGDASTPAWVRPDRLENATSGRLRWRSLSGLSLRQTDLLLLEQAIKNLDGYIPLIRQHLGGPSVGFWGHGRSYSSHQARSLASWKQFVTRRAEWFFAYTESGAEAVMEGGFPPTRITTLNNTLDTDGLAADLSAVSNHEVASWAQQLQIDPEFTALFMGGVDGRKDLKYLLSAAEIASQLEPRFTLVIGGSGTDIEHLRAREEAGAPVRVVGRLDGRRRAIALRAASVLCIPSQLGLVVIDSFVSAIPIITRSRRLHGPEADYLEDGVDSVWLEETASPRKFATETLRLMHDPERRDRLCRGSASKAPKYSMESMVSSFVSGVLDWSETRRFGL